MKFNTWAPALALLLLTIATPRLSYARPIPGQPQAPSSDGVTANATQTCTYSFSTGSGATFLKFCVSANGNIVQFQSPAGIESIANGNPFESPAEGYGICDLSAVGTGPEYSDYAISDIGNWTAPKLVTKTATEVVIARTTGDGLWTFTQTITMIPGPPPDAKVQMQLKNNSKVTKNAYLVRFANVNADNAFNASQNSLDGSANGAWGYVPIGNGIANSYGLRIQDFPAVFNQEIQHVGFPQSVAAPPAVCAPAGNFHGTQTNTDGSIMMWYTINNIKAAQTVNVTVKYVAF